MDPSCLTLPSLPKRLRQEMNPRVSSWNQGTDSEQTEKRIFLTQSPTQSFYWWSQLQEFLSPGAAVWAPASPWNQDTPTNVSKKCRKLNYQTDRLVTRGWEEGTCFPPGLGEVRGVALSCLGSLGLRNSLSARGGATLPSLIVSLQNFCCFQIKQTQKSY